MRLAELITAAVLALLSIYLMFKSAELDIGYLPGEGPGAVLGLFGWHQSC